MYVMIWAAFLPVAEDISLTSAGTNDRNRLIHDQGRSSHRMWQTRYRINGHTGHISFICRDSSGSKSILSAYWPQLYRTRYCAVEGALALDSMWCGKWQRGTHLSREPAFQTHGTLVPLRKKSALMNKHTMSVSSGYWLKPLYSILKNMCYPRHLQSWCSISSRRALFPRLGRQSFDQTAHTTVLPHNHSGWNKDHQRHS